MYDTKNYSKALKYINYIIEKSPKEAKFYHLRASIYEKKQRKELAARDKTHATKIEDITISVQKKLLVQYQDTNLNKALSLASQLAISYPHRAIGFRERGRILLRKNKWQSAIPDLQTAIRLNAIPEDYKMLGYLEHKIGNKSDALLCYQKSDAMSRISDDVSLQIMLALQVNLKKYQSAIATGKRISAKVPQDLLQIARAYYYLQNYSKAKKLLQQIMSLKGKLQIETLYYQAITLYESGEKEIALPLLKSLANNPKALDHKKYIVLFYLGQWEFANENYESAFKYLQIAVQLNNEHAQTNFLLGKCYHLRQEYQIAVELYTKAIHLEPWVGIFYKERAFCYNELKQTRRANHDFLYAVELNIDNLYTVTNVYENMIFEEDPFERFSWKKMLRGRIFHTYIEKDIDLFSEEKKKLSRSYSQAATLRNTIPDSKDIERAQRFLETIRTRQERGVDEIAYDGLKGMFIIERVREMIKETIKEENLSPQIQEKLRSLNVDVRDKYIENQKAHFRKIISRYYMTEDHKTLFSLYNNKEINIKVLQKVLLDPWEDMITRFYAGQILFRIARSKLIKFFQQVYETQPQTTQLLIKILIQKNNRKTTQLALQKIPQNTPAFLQVQLVEMLPTNHPLFDSLLNSSYPKVSLSAARKMWLVGDRQPQKLLLKHSQSSNKIMRAFALKALWSIDQFPQKFKKQFIDEHNQILLLAVEDQEPLVRKVALSKMKSLEKPIFIKKIKEHIRNDEVAVRLQALFSLTVQGDMMYLLNIAANTKEYPALRLAPLIYFEKTKNKNNASLFEVVKVIKKLAKDKAQSMRFITIEYLMRTSKGNLIKYFLDDIDMKKINSAWAMANGLLECRGEVSDLLLELSKHKSERVRAAAYMSLVNNYVQHQKIKKLNKLHKFILKQDSKTRSHAAFGYSFYLYKYNYLANLFSSNINSFENNGNYLQFLETLEKRLPRMSLKERRIFQMCTQKAAELAPQNDRYLLENAVIEYLLGNASTSLVVLERIKQKNSLVLYWMTRAYMKQNKFSLAQQKIKQAIKKQPWNEKFIKLKLQITLQKPK
ncbi:tetratricopeptide repeat protein [Candidatus Uabimicrobium sp. HlEnr_7]|uniref:tetratricopeptide repeat protein n=1 Tax=Candidatus Uabimicrobium helgolandensis TaxID=3095367 RepID=UPI003558E1CD